MLRLIPYSISNMTVDISKNIKLLRLSGLPEDLRRALKEARNQHNWSQRDLASRVGLTQTHISGIESGKIVPRYDTLLELVRVLGSDLLMVPRALVPVVQSIIRDHLHSDQIPYGEEGSLYADGNDQGGKEPGDQV